MVLGGASALRLRAFQALLEVTGFQDQPAKLVQHSATASLAVREVRAALEVREGGRHLTISGTMAAPGTLLGTTVQTIWTIHARAKGSMAAVRAVPQSASLVRIPQAIDPAAAAAAFLAPQALPAPQRPILV